MNRNPPIIGPNGTSECRRCGTCCRKGGPALHLDDRPLIEGGTIPLRCLYTIRRGEPAYDAIRGAVLPVASEIIKLMGSGDEWTCTFYDEAERHCCIYSDRPLECRLLKCWDTRDLEKLYETDRLTRKDLLEPVAGLWDLVADHEMRCGYERVGALAARVRAGNDDALMAAVREAVNYDAELRRLLIEKSLCDPQILDFLLGRPLEIIIESTGLKLRPKDDRLP